MNILLFIHALITLALIGVILIQRSEGGGLGIGSGTSSMFTSRGVSNLLTKVTATLATLFFVNCLLMGVVAKNHIREKTSLLNVQEEKENPLALPETPKS